MLLPTLVTLVVSGQCSSLKNDFFNKLQSCIPFHIPEYIKNLNKLKARAQCKQTFKNNKSKPVTLSFPTCELWTTSGRENSLLSQLHQQSTKRHTLLSSIGCGVTPALSAHPLNIVMLCGGRLADAIITHLCNGSF